jgi:periplasmic protein TonB
MKSPLVVTSLGIHIVAVTGLFIAGFWKLDRLEPGRQRIDLAVASQPPPAESGSPAAAKAEPFKKKRPRATRDLVQPQKLDLDDKPTTTTSEDGQGTGGTGSGAGSGSGSDPNGTGSCADPPCGDARPTVPPLVPKPVFVPPAVIKGMRISGETQIVPPATVKTAILRDGHKRVVAVFRVCVAQRGEISSIDVQKPSGYPAYDSALVAGLRGWRYRPYEVNNRPIAVCGVVTFVYSIQ